MAEKIGVWLQYGNYVFCSSAYKTRHENLKNAWRMLTDKFRRDNKRVPQSKDEFIEGDGRIEFYDPENPDD